MRKRRFVEKNLVLGLLGGILYFFLETVFTGKSHWTMFLIGGVCFVLIGLINELLSWKTPLWIQALMGAVIITTMEFITGLIVNVWLKWDIWDYSNLPYNLLGQICLPYFIIWIVLSVLAIILDDWLRHWLFEEQKPVYVLF